MKKIILLSIALAISLKASAFKAEVYIHALGRGNLYSKMDCDTEKEVHKIMKVIEEGLK